MKRVGLIAAALAAALAGCGSNKTQTVTLTSTSSFAATTDTTASATTGPAPPGFTTATTTATTTTSSSTTAPAAHLSTFRSPSANIGCVLVGGFARCDIAKRDWTPPPRPASCRLDYGQGLEVGASGSGHLVCAGDTALNQQATPLAYGSSSRVGSFTCASATNGMTCTNTATGHGFFISIQSYRAF